MLGLEGHEYSYHLAFHQALLELGLTHELYFPKRAAPLSVPSFWKKGLRKKTLFLTLNFFRIFLFRKGARFFFMESYTENNLKAFSLAARLFSRKGDSVWLLVRDVWSGCGVQEKKGPLYLKRLKKSAGFALLTDSEKFIPTLEEKAHCKAHLLPVLFLEEGAPVLQSPKERIGCLFHGKPKKSKGVHHMQRLLELKEPATEHFEISVSFEFPPTEDKESNQLKLRCFEPALPRAGFLHELLTSDIVLLPYLPKVYNFRTSGIFVEAIFYGKMVVVHEGTLLAYELRKYGLEKLIVDWENPHFFSHLLSLYNDEIVREKLKQMQESYKKMHSLEGLKETLRVLITLD